MGAEDNAPATIQTYVHREDCMCAICYRYIDKDKTDTIWGETAPGMPHPNMAMHAICYALRASCGKSFSKPSAPVKEVRQLDLLTDLSAGTPCFLCDKEIGDTEPVRQYVGCLHRLAHSVCVALVCNTKDKFTCPKSDCTVSTPAMAIKDKVLDWCSPAGRSYPGVVSRALSLPPPPDAQVIAHQHSTILGMLEKKTDVAVVLAVFEMRKAAPGDVGFATLGRRIIYELGRRTASDIVSISAMESGGEVEGKCVLRFLRDCGYTGDDVLAMGFTLPMLAGDKDNLALLLDREFMPTKCLTRPPLSATFVDLLLAGANASLFAELKYTCDDLGLIQFNVPAFIAAGGTPTELAAMDIHDTDLAMTFSYSRCIKENWA